MEGILTRKTAVVISSALFISVVLHLLSLQKVTPPSQRLTLGVLSARENFLQRQTIRDTWGSAVKKVSDVEMKFVLGDHDCSIHPDDRISPYGCQMWHLNNEWKVFKPEKFVKCHYTQYQKKLRNFVDCYIGLGFKVLHPIIIKKLMVQSEVLKRSNNSVLVFSDPEEVVVQVVLSHNNCHEEGNMCSIKVSPHMRLPKGFEGELKLFNSEKNEDLCGMESYDFQNTENWICDWSNGSVLEYTFLRTRKNTLTKWHKSSSPLVSAQFSIADKHILMEEQEDRAYRAEEWKRHLANIEQKVEEEGSAHRDLLMLPHLDVYNNLPQKVMGFLSWSALKQNSTYVMKIDDDVFLNVKLLNKLIEEPEEDQVWWSLFHYHRAVPVYGKWADLTYPALTYPKFPAGAGYLMTKSLVRAVVGAQHHLVSHGGEDVSMGIWVSSVSDKVRHVEVPCWLPHVSCSQTVLVSQLSIQEIIDMWHTQVNSMPHKNQ